MNFLSRLYHLVLLHGLVIYGIPDHQQQPLGIPVTSGEHHGHLKLNEHLEDVRRKSYADFSKSPVVNANEFEAMQSHILYMYEGVREPEKTFSFVRSNSVIDCLVITEQPTYHHLKLEDIGSPPTD